MKLQLHLLGRFEVLRDGVVIDAWPRAGAKRLLKMLAVEPRHALSTERLAATLWPRDSGDRLNQRLHNVLYLLRSTLEPDTARTHSKASCLQVRDRIVSLATGDRVWIDIDEFEQRLDSALPDAADIVQLERALELYRGPLLPDDASEEWLASPRMQLEQRYLNATHALASRYQARNNHEGAIVLLQRLLKTAPADERAHRELIGLYGRVGRLFEAERQYAECKAALSRELAVAPSDETRKVYRKAVQAPSAASDTAKTPPASAAATEAAEPGVRFRPPAPLVKLIGREALVDQVCRQLQAGATRLLTLTGTGGVGKTQLAIRVANELVNEYRHGVCFVSLGEVNNDGVLDRIRRALGLTESAKSSGEELITGFLQDKHLLLVLDNFEHVLDSAALVPRLLQNCAMLTVLATSRTRLNLVPERIAMVPPLEVAPAHGEIADAKRISPAEALFVERARAVNAAFERNHASRADIAAITRRLDGVPLAIELVAARSAMFDPSSICASLERSFDLAADGGPDRPERQLSLGKSIAWSYELLSPLAKRILCRISLFATGFESRTALAISYDLAGNGSGALQQVVNSGLVIASATSRTPEMASPSFQMLQATREFARERLDQDGDSALVKRKFALYYANRAVELDDDLSSPKRDAAVETFRSEHENFFAALEFSEQICDSNTVCRLVRGLCRYWGPFGIWHRALEWVNRAIQLAPSVDTDLQAELFYSAAVYFNQYALYARGEEHARTAIAMARSTGNKRTFVRAVNSLAFVLLRQMRAAEAIPLLEHSRAAALELDDPSLTSLSLLNLGACLEQNGQAGEAVASLMAALDYRDRVSGHSHSIMLKNLATSVLVAGRHSEALSLIEQAIAIQENIASSPQYLAGFWNTKAWIWNMLGKPEDSLQCSEEATRIATAGNYAGALDMASSARGMSLALSGDLEQARTILVDAIARLEVREDIEWIFECQQWMCWVCLEDPDSAPSTKIWLERLLAQRRILNRPSVPRLLETAAMYLTRIDGHCPAAAAWLHAERLRAEMGVVRFPAEESHAKKTLDSLGSVLGANWRDAVDLPPTWAVSADPLDWLVEFIEGRVDSPDSFVPANSGEMALGERNADAKRAT